MRDPATLLPLTSVMFHVLLSLSDADLHGYGMLKEIEERTGGAVTLSTGTLYGVIKRALADGLIVESRRRPRASEDDERRRYYRLTDFGRQVRSEEHTSELQSLRHLVCRLL